jgi:hypothetical protein
LGRNGLGKVAAGQIQEAQDILIPSLLVDVEKATGRGNDVVGDEVPSSQIMGHIILDGD